MQASRCALLVISAALFLNPSLADDIRSGDTSPPPQKQATKPEKAPDSPPKAPAPPKALHEIARTRVRDVQDRFVAETAIKRRATYALILSELGLNQDQITQISDKLIDLHREAITAGDAMMRLAKARANFDREIKELLGDENYLEYRAFEDAKPFRREVEHLKELAATRRIMIEPVVEQELVRLFQQLDLQTMESWDGPYDPFPAPRVGEAQILPGTVLQLTRVSERFLALQHSAEWRALPLPIRDVTAEYLTQKIQGMQRSVHLLSLPREEQRKLLPTPGRRQPRPIDPDLNL